MEDLFDDDGIDSWFLVNTISGMSNVLPAGSQLWAGEMQVASHHSGENRFGLQNQSTRRPAVSFSPSAVLRK